MASKYSKWYTCPSLTSSKKCQWMGEYEGLKNHIKFTHSHMWTYTPNFAVATRKDIEQNMLLSALDNIFLVQLKTDLTAGKAWLGIRFIGDPQEAFTFTYKVSLHIEKQSNRQRKKGKMQLDSDWGFDLSQMCEFQLDAAQAKGHGCHCVVTIGKGTKEDPPAKASIHENLVKELKCPVETCRSSLVPPIFVCQMGLSVCSDCREEQKDGPFSCLIDGKTLRNLTLEKLTTYLQYPCKNQQLGCNFVGGAYDIKGHERKCMFSIVLCPLQGCTCITTKANLQEHLVKVHSDKWVTSNQLTQHTVDSDRVVSDCLLKFDGRIFHITRKQLSTNGAFYWNCEMVDVDLGEQQIYKLRIEVVDHKDLDSVLGVTIKAEKKITAGATEKGIAVPYELLKALVVENKLLVRYKIEKA